MRTSWTKASKWTTVERVGEKKMEEDGGGNREEGASNRRLGEDCKEGQAQRRVFVCHDLQAASGGAAGGGKKAQDRSVVVGRWPMSCG